MPKFYIKTVIASMFLTLFVMIYFDMVKGIKVSDMKQKLSLVLIISDITFIILNEKVTVRENWKWHMWLILIIITLLSGYIIL